MSKIVYDFRGQKVAKTLIFYTHTHTHTHTHLIIAEKKKSPAAILTETISLSFREIRLTLHSALEQVYARVLSLAVLFVRLFVISAHV
jgi:hypothetical protein